MHLECAAVKLNRKHHDIRNSKGVSQYTALSRSSNGDNSKPHSIHLTILEMADQSIASQTPSYAELNNFVVPNYSSVLCCRNVCLLPKATSSQGL